MTADVAVGTAPIPQAQHVFSVGVLILVEQIGRPSVLSCAGVLELAAGGDGLVLWHAFRLSETNSAGHCCGTLALTCMPLLLWYADVAEAPWFEIFHDFNGLFFEVDVVHGAWYTIHSPCCSISIALQPLFVLLGLISLKLIQELLCILCVIRDSLV